MIEVPTCTQSHHQLTPPRYLAEMKVSRHQQCMLIYMKITNLVIQRRQRRRRRRRIRLTGQI
ncbi:hypothetical protein Hanom_Chr01g00043091 [Helianthus anomalus]